mmetsp:Transcript_17348/g.34075  ORF Transcript_17348/g.34075 Transcript_17348/m.34075 type:complete len:343 (+) Transcript_17348:303-1331(+)|eukprot:CAMPEP_0171520048 /NCGR_PEP_ID=MMETSP0959-20130129/6270_1 /TAXON_ID=87120 /ORGANISM="Aurantiochytrium limacinum, Strain ATCCMYA-1381" /LENGTH=342 /DNA_ID=CAMNT_0012059615 /DNA_START=428 /DNA_END=1456 /DNA_ORIENTATION=+
MLTVESKDTTATGDTENVEEEDPLLRHYRYKKVASVFDRLDVGGNGCISFAEFLTQVEKLTPDEIEAARGAFTLLNPDKDGNVKRRKYIQMQIEAFDDVLDAEFDRWVRIMTKGSIVHAHKREELEAAGIEVPEDYIDPPTFSIIRLGWELLAKLAVRTHAFLFAASIRRREVAYQASADARAGHIRRIQKLKYRLDAHDKTLLDIDHARAIEALQEKAKIRGTQVPPLPRKAKQESPQHKNQRSRRAAQNNNFDVSLREEKSVEESQVRGRKLGNEVPPLFIESSNIRLNRARQAAREALEKRIMEDISENEKLPVTRGSTRVGFTMDEVDLDVVSQASFS